MPFSTELIEKFSLDNRVAVVTGAASGLGQESARILASAGASLILSDINSKSLQETAELVSALGSKALIKPTDVSDRDQVEALADFADKEFGKLDIWVNSAGIPLVADILETDEADARRNIDVNMLGTFWGCAAAARVMKNSGGSIVNFSSGGGETAVPGISLYCMTKAAVNQLTRISALEFGKFGIRVNAVAPGWINTPMGSTLYRDKQGNIDPVRREQVLEQQASLSPLGINGTPMDIAMAVLYLASDASAFMTGRVLTINGGVAV